MRETAILEYMKTKIYNGDFRMEMSASVFEVDAKMEIPFYRLTRQAITINFSGLEKRSVVALKGSIVANWTYLEKDYGIGFDLEMEARDQNEKFTAKMESSLEVPLIEARYERRITEQNIMEVDVEFVTINVRIPLSLRIDSSGPKLAEVDLRFHSPPDKPLRFSGSVGQHGPVYIFEARAELGSDTLIVKGSSNAGTSWENFEINMLVDVLNKGSNIYEVQMLCRSADKRRRMELNVNERQKPVFSTKVVYDTKENKNVMEIRGNAELSTREPVIAVKYVIEKKSINKADEMGTELRIKLDMTTSMLNVNKMESALKVTNKEKSLTISASDKENKIEQFILAHKKKITSASNINEYSAMLRTKKDRSETARGLRAKFMASASKLEHTAEWVVDEAKGHIIGCKFYSKDGEHSLEIVTPKRTVAAVLETPKSQKYSTKRYVLSIWLDRVNDADNRLTIGAIISSRKVNEADSLSALIQIRHPSLDRHLEYKVELLTGSTHSFSVKLEVDALDDVHQKWIVESFVTRSQNVTVETVIRSSGSMLGARLLLNWHAADSDRALGANLQLFDQGTTVKELFINLNANKETVLLRLGSPNETVVFESRFSFEDVVGYPRIQFTGLSKILDLPILSTTFDVSAMPYVDIRVFDRDTPENYYSVSGGLVQVDQFEMSVACQIGNVQKRDVIGVTASLKTSQLLHTRLSWDDWEVNELAKIARNRVHDVKSQVGRSLQMLGRELEPFAHKWKTFESPESALASFAANYSRQFEQMISDLKSTYLFADLLSAVNIIMKSYSANIMSTKNVDKIRNSIVDTVDAIINDIPDGMAKIGQKISNISFALFEDIVENIDYLTSPLMNRITASGGILQSIRGTT